FIAVLLNTKFKGHQLVKAIFFIPVIYNMTVINNTLSGQFGTLFRSDLDQGFALSQQFSAFVMQIGIGNGLVGFLTDAVNRIFTIVNKSGIQILVFIAALQSIPAHLYEAAKVEGATKYEMFWKITIPMISPMVLTAAVYTIVDSFVGSELMQFMTVNSQGTTMSTNRPGLYSAISIVYFLANAFIIAIIFLLMRKRVFYYDK
ncbi:MAG: ABC transporter permease subunit, partial [Methanoregula sp.]